jgi:class 3 adenylate cyclase
MANRKHIPEEVRTRLLTACRRRCCLCWHFEGSKSQEQGQIVHIDRDATNPNEENLAFLCLRHHNEYDTRPSQSKGLTPGELLEGKAALLKAIADNPQAFLAGVTPQPSAPVFDQQGQTVENQTNVAADLVLEATPSTRGSQSGSPDCDRDGEADTIRCATREPVSDTNSIQGEILPADVPDPLYIVFCWISDIKEMPADKLASAVQTLADVCKEASDLENFNVWDVRSSVYGRLLCVRNAADALDAAIRVLDEAAKHGLTLAIGVSEGKVERFSDLGGDNLVGPPINLAARLAAMLQARGKIVVTTGVHDSVVQVSRYPENRFIGPEGGRVKRTVFPFYYLSHSASEVGTLPHGNAHRPINAHVLVFDIVRFSEKSRDEQWRLVTDLHREVVGVMRSLGCGDRAEKGRLWYAPAGDGGVVVFSTDEAGREVAWNLAEHLSRRCRERFEIRSGISSGQAVIVGDNLPVGTGVLRADELSGKPETWDICVSTDFWGELPESVKREWIATPVADDEHALLIHSEIQGNAEPVAPSSATTDTDTDAGGQADETVYGEEELGELQRRVAAKVAKIIGEKAGMFHWVGRHLDGQPTDVEGIAMGLSENSVTASLGLLVTALRDLDPELPEPERAEVTRSCSRIVDELLRLCLHPDYISKLRATYNSTMQQLDVTTDRPCLVAVLVAELFERSAIFHTEGREPRAPRHTNAIESARFPDFGGDERRVVDDVKRFLWNCIFPTDDYEADRIHDLRTKLVSAAEQKDPWFLTVEGRDDVPWNEIAAACPGLLLLRVIREGPMGEILVDESLLVEHLKALMSFFNVVRS